MTYNVRFKSEMLNLHFTYVTIIRLFTLLRQNFKNVSYVITLKENMIEVHSLIWNISCFQSSLWDDKYIEQDILLNKIRTTNNRKRFLY